MPKPAAHGTTARYRAELKAKSVCERCRSANTKAKSLQRARAKQNGTTPVLSLVPDVQIGSTPDTVPDLPERPKPHHVPAWSATEKAVHADLAALPADTPFLASLSAVALALAREIDDVNGKGSKATPAKQLTDVIRELKQKSGGSGDTFNDLLALLASPLVPPSNAPVRDTPKPRTRKPRTTD